MEESQVPTVALFVTCLVDLMRPSVGFAAVRLLEAAGCSVAVPEQTCCGQPAYNSGDRASSRSIARSVIDAFEGFDYVVVPSGSCAAMIKIHYPQLFDDDPDLRWRAEGLAARTFELTEFLAARSVPDLAETSIDGVVTYHDGCSGLRELGIKEQPRRLLDQVAGLEVREAERAEACCGFGGTFCVSYPEISESIVDAKVDDILATGADTVLGGDLGCLFNIAGRLKRRGAAVKVRHVAEVLAGDLRRPAIGDAAEADDGDARWT